MNKMYFELINQLILSISQLLWPLITLTAILMFKKDISKLIHGIKKGNIFGNEFEIDREIDELSRKADESSERVVNIDFEQKIGADIDIVDYINKEPKIGVIHIASELEKEIRHLTSAVGLVTGYGNLNIHQSIQMLEDAQVVPKSTSSSLKLFWDLRNKIVHGKNVEDNSDIIRIIDIGVVLLRTIKAIPRESHFVFAINIPVYEDSECLIKRDDIKAVMLEVISAGGLEKQKRIYPSNKKFIVGKKVSWEWDTTNIWGESWYVDPDTKEIKYAWTSSGEFIGRDIEQI